MYIYNKWSGHFHYAILHLRVVDMGLYGGRG